MKKTTSSPRIASQLNKFSGAIISWLISVYQYTISPDKGVFSRFLKGRVCAHIPHCSAYGKQCMKRYGFWPGIAYTTERVLSCKPRMEKIYDPASYRIVFFSGSPIWVPFLEQLHNDPRYDVVGVVTMPDKPIGRGHHIQENIIATTSADLGITDILKPTSLKSTTADGEAVAAKLQSLQADYFVVVAYGKIMPQHILDIPVFGPINVHGSILPEYRGASPLQTVFLDNKKETGLTIMRMNEKMDEWDIVATYAFPLPFAWTSKELFEKVKHVWPWFLSDTLWELAKWHIHAKSQDPELATYCTKIDKQDGFIDLWETPLSTVYNKYRAYALWPKIRTTGSEKYERIAGKILVIDRLVCDEELYKSYMNEPLISPDNALNPAVTTLLIKPEGKKAIAWDDFVNGYM